MPLVFCGYCPATFRTEEKRRAHVENRRALKGGLREHDEDKARPWIGAQETPIVVQVLGPSGKPKDPPGMLFNSARLQFEKKFGRPLQDAEEETVREFLKDAGLEGS